MAKKKEMYVIDLNGLLTVTSMRSDIEEKLLKGRDYQTNEISNYHWHGVSGLPYRVQYLIELSYMESIWLAFKLGRIMGQHYFGTEGVSFGKAVME